jgi:hypothetical protein
LSTFFYVDCEFMSDIPEVPFPEQAAWDAVKAEEKRKFWACRIVRVESKKDFFIQLRFRVLSDKFKCIIII